MELVVMYEISLTIVHISVISQVECEQRKLDEQNRKIWRPEIGERDATLCDKKNREKLIFFMITNFFSANFQFWAKSDIIIPTIARS
jgi:hypothetical protein